ncbi:MAG: hypothetical protein QM802_06630 [Agriterribacter sp.]
MKRFPVLLLVVLFALHVTAQNAGVEKNYYGAINKTLKVVLQIKNTNGTISGFYFYEKKGIDIKLTGKQDGNKISLFELDYLAKPVAEINGEILKNELRGQWKSIASGKTFPIQVTETNHQIEPLHDSIAGNYIIKADDDNGTTNTERCPVQFRITKSKGEYFYLLQTDTRKVNGKVHFSRPIDEKSIYIIFEGLLCAEGCSYVEGMLSENEIVIQNYGNAMNEYLRFKECGEKYITLSKE